MRYRLVQCIDGRLIKSEFIDNNVFPAMEARGFTLKGVLRDSVGRAELQGQPRFTGVLGPFWDGDAVRYEDQETYRQLSE